MSIKSLNNGDGTFVCGVWFVDEIVFSNFEAFWKNLCGKDEGYEGLEGFRPGRVETCSKDVKGEEALVARF